MGIELVVRSAEARDMADLSAISRCTWEGHDYLERVADRWLADPGFIVGELDGRVVACGRIARLPGDVAWLEGLRVHPDFRGRGFGRVMSERLLSKALKLMSEGFFTSIEFSTYVHNVRSRAIAEQQGFSIVELFHVLYLERPSGPAPGVDVVSTCLRRGDLDIYSEHAPCGWKYLQASNDGAEQWLRDHADFLQTERGARFLVSRRDSEISPLASSLEDPEGFVRGVVSFAASRALESVEIMVHDSHSQVLSAALNAGFSYWEEPEAANILVYRHCEP